MSQTSRPLLEQATLTPKSYLASSGNTVFFKPWPVVVQRQYDANYQERDFDATEFASRLRAVEGAGYSIGHYFGFLSPRDRVVARQQMASNRQQVAVKEKELYFALGVRGVRLQPLSIRTGRYWITAKIKPCLSISSEKARSEVSA